MLCLRLSLAPFNSCQARLLSLSLSGKGEETGQDSSQQGGIGNLLRYTSSRRRDQLSRQVATMSSFGQSVPWPFPSLAPQLVLTLFQSTKFSSRMRNVGEKLVGRDNFKPHLPCGGPFSIPALALGQRQSGQSRLFSV